MINDDKKLVVGVLLSCKGSNILLQSWIGATNSQHNGGLWRVKVVRRISANPKHADEPQCDDHLDYGAEDYVT